MKFSVVGAGYVGLSLAVLISQKYEVSLLDTSEAKINSINQKISPIKDYELEKHLVEKKLKLMNKYEIGINQWIGTKNSFQKKESLFNQIMHPRGNLSLCSKADNPIFFDSKLNYEKIYVLKDSNREIFFETIDNIFR